MHSRYSLRVVFCGAVAVSALSGCPSADPGSDIGMVLQENAITTDTTIGPGSFLVNTDLVVSGGAVLTLAPGTTLRFAEGTGLFVESDGALNAVGTPDARILLTGKTATRGSWSGLSFNGSHSAGNQLAFVTIEYGGAYTAAPNARSARYPSNLTIEGDTLLAVTNCVLRESETFGFNFAPSAVGAAITAFAGNTITLNTLGAGRLEAWHAGLLDVASSYTGNDVDVVFIGGEGPTHTLADVTWPALDVYYFLASNLVIDHMLTIADGAGLLLGSTVSILPGESGGMRVNASSESRPSVARANNIAPPPDHPLHSQYTLPADFGSQGPVGPSWNNYPTIFYDPNRQEFYNVWDMTLTPDNVFAPELLEFLNNLPWWKPSLPQQWFLDGINYEYIPANVFYMGAPEDEVGSHPWNERPLHRVQMTYGFYLSKTEITQGQWRRIMGTEENCHFTLPCPVQQAPYSLQDPRDDNLPMRYVSWHDAQAFVAALQARNPGRRFRLPTEAEWESAARAGSTTRFYWGDDPSLASIDTYAWTWGNSGSGDWAYVQAVDLLRPNAWGLLDMSGNVNEWVQDRYHDNYNSAPADGSAWGTPERTPADESDFLIDPYFPIYGVVRGGCYWWHETDARSASRHAADPDSRQLYTGFRIVMEE